MFGVGLRSPTYKRFVRISYIIFFSFLSFTCYCFSTFAIALLSFSVAFAINSVAFAISDSFSPIS